MQKRRRVSGFFAYHFLVVTVFCGFFSSHCWAVAAKHPVFLGGYRFPALKVRYTQYRKRWNLYIRSLNFTTLVGKRPFVMLYYKPNHAPSEVELVAFDKACRLLEKKLACLAIAPIRRFRDIRAIYRRLKELQLNIRVLLDDRHLLSYITLTKHLPSYSAVAKSGFLRLVNAASLTERVTAKWTLVQFLQQLAAGKEPRFVRAPGFSPNPFVKVGSKVLPFQLQLVSLSIREKMTDKKLFSAKKKQPTLMLFWSLSCSLCRQFVPLFDKFALLHKKHFQVISFAQAKELSAQKQVKLFLKQKKIQMNVCLSPKGKIFDAYHVLQVPTLLIVDHGKVIRNVRIGAGGAFEKDVLRMVQGL